jgi:Holliday junction resolvase
MGLMSRNKGKTGERELCKLLRESLGDIGTFERNSMQAHGEARSGYQADILTNLPLDLEVKRTEEFKPKPWLEQARAQSKGDGLPVVAHRSNGEPWRFLMELTGAEFCRMVRALHMFNKLPKEVQAKLLAGPQGVASDLLTHEGDK